MNRRPTALLFPFLAAVLPHANALAQAPTEAELLAAFARLPAARQAAVLEASHAASPAHPLLASAGRLAATAPTTAPTHGKAGRRPAKKGKAARADRTGAPAPLPLRVRYDFGAAAIVAGPVAAANGRRVDPVPLQHALAGALPDADRVLAALLQRLDQDAAVRPFAALLAGWRDGDESFYDALDRTAGTPEGVFVYDAMLDDFRQRCAREHKELRRSLDDAHTAMHAAFLAYRQYRAFREALAWSIVLPPDVPLPASLARYEAPVPGLYSLREQVVMALAACDDDADALVARVLATAKPLPSPLWGEPYDPFGGWRTVFEGLMDRMVQRSGSTDAFLAKALAERRELARQLRDGVLAQFAPDAVVGPVPRTGAKGR